MILSSGLPPYEYATATPFKVANPYIGQLAIGPSGILLEQAQFVITAELRRFNRLLESHALPNFFIYTNFYGPTSYQYEPKVDGSTLSSSGSISIIDHIEDTRLAFEILMVEYASDNDFSDVQIRADWLQNAYRNSPSGFYFATELGFYGHWAHRNPSEAGLLNYLSDEVLGGSGVLYDIDFGEVMFNPYPYMSFSNSIDARGRRVNGLIDPYEVLAGPIFPSFQKLDGSLIALNGFEPLNTVGLYNLLVLPIASGMLRVDGYCLRENTDYRFGSFFDFNNTLDFETEGIRSVGAAGNLDTARIYATPPALLSGVYQILARNRKVNYPNTTVESGTISIWPSLDRYYGTSVPGVTASETADEDFNNGYHVFDETLWITDRTTNTTNAASGLVVLSPWTGHQLWLRYADPQQVPLTGAWGSHHALERTLADNIYRIHSVSIADVVSNLQEYTFHKYDDLLNYISSTTTDGNPNTVRGAGGEVTITDMFYDGTNFFLLGAAGSGMVEIDGAFNYSNSWAVFSDAASPALSGCGSRAFFADGKYYFYIPQQPGPGDALGVAVGGLNMRSSGIIEFSFSTGNRLTLDAIKYVRGEKIFGSNIPVSWRYHDIRNVPTSPHLTPGIWALCAVRRTGEASSSNYLFRLEEQSDYWEIVGFMRLNHGSTPDPHLGGGGTSDMLYMPI